MTSNKAEDSCLDSVSKETNEHRTHVSLLAKHPTVETLWRPTASVSVSFFFLLGADGL